MRLDLNGRRGILPVGDLHGCADAGRAMRYMARINDLYIVFLGDVASRGNDPVGAMELVAEVVEAGEGMMIGGNHDQSWRLAATVPPAERQTLSRLNRRIWDAIEAEPYVHIPDRHRIAQRFTQIAHRAPLWARHGDDFFVHAGFDPAMLEIESSRASGRLRHFAMHGQPTGRSDANGSGIRDHGWVDTVPAGMRVFFGHDVLATDVPARLEGRAGGVAYAMDTGCVFHGRLSGAALVPGYDITFIHTETREPLRARWDAVPAEKLAV